MIRKILNRNNILILKCNLSSINKPHIYAKGCGIFGALGVDNDLYDYSSYTRIELSLGNGDEVNSVSSGYGHSAILSEKGDLYICGRPYDFTTLLRINRIHQFSSYFARLIALSTNSKFFGGEKLGFYPSPIKFADNIRKVACSAGLTIALDFSGNVYCFGLNRWKQCGITITNNDSHVYQPAKVRIPLCQSIDCGMQHCIALTMDGQVYTWGKAARGQLGHKNSDSTESCLPVKIAFSEAFGKYAPKIVGIGAGFSHCAALSEEGMIYVWGKGMSKTEKSQVSDQLVPRKIKLPDKRRGVEIVCSSFSTVIRASDGSLWVIGMGEHDRNFNADPLRVQTDFDHTKTRDFLLKSESVNSNTEINSAGNTIEYIHLEQDAALKKGYQRVSVLFPVYYSDAINSNIDSKNSKLISGYSTYEVIIHKGEAYVMPLTMKSKESSLSDEYQGDDLYESEYLNNYNIIDYSAGWKHSLLCASKIN
eukprot:gene7357-10027_t